MTLGVLYALAAGLMWGLVFVAPLMLPAYAPVLLAVGRYLAFGCIALPLALAFDRRALRELAAADWLEAAKLSAVGNFLYYLTLASAIQLAGAPLPTMIIGTLPVVIAITANRRNHARDGLLPWRRLAPSLLLIAAGLALVNQGEIEALRTAGAGPEQLHRYAQGGALALVALVCWTWYPIRNADWLREHAAPGGDPTAAKSPRAWATAQGLVTLPMAALGLALLWPAQALWPGLLGPGFAFPLGPQPLHFVALMGAIGLCASWLGTLCWNEASQRLPTSLSGQLIVFETLSALTYAFALARRWPPATTLVGVGLLIAGVVWALRIKPESLAPGQVAHDSEVPR
jgi:drug/metabolite transporter (DMT)-like permease